MKSFLSAMQQHRLLAIVAATLLGLTACGGGSSGSSSTSAKTSVQGVLVDPAIKNASIRLNNSAGDAITSVVRTDEQGKFTFPNVNARQLTDAQLLSHGGIDTVTGTDFTGVTFKAQYQTGDRILITPLTTLVVEEMESSNTDYANAVVAIAQRFNLTNEQVLGNPTLDIDLQKVSLQVSELATALRTLGGFAYVNELTADFGTNWDDIASSVSNNADALDSVKQRMHTLANELTILDDLTTVDSASQLMLDANRIRFNQGVLNFFKNSLNYTPSATALVNIQNLSNALVAANNNKGIPSDSSHFANIIRYVFKQYNLNTNSFSNSDWTVPEGLTTDSKIATIAQSSSVIDHTIPLLESEYLTTNKAKRDYFYASDLAPAYRALTLFENVYDNSQTDDVFASIAANYAMHNMLDKADVILKSQIFSPFYVADGYRRTGDALKAAGDLTKANQYWNESLRLARIYLNDKGSTNLDAADAALFQSLSSSLLKHGDPNVAADVLTPVNDFIAANSGTYTTAFARIVVAMSTQVNNAVNTAVNANLRSDLKAEALQKAELYGDILDGLGLQASTSGSTAIACGTHYKLKANNLLGLAGYYISLEEPNLVRSTLQRFIDLRATHECTRLETNVYVKNTLDAYIYLNDLTGYIALIDNTMDGAKEADITAARSAANQYLDIQKALNGQVQEAIESIISADNDLNTQVQQLTNVGISESSTNARLAVILFQQNASTAGEDALTAAWNIVSDDDYKSLNLIDGTQYSRYGCAKIARLTYQHSNTNTGINRLQQCENLITHFESEATTLEASLAYGYLAENAFIMNQANIGINAFNNALRLAQNLSDIDKISALTNVIYYSVTNGGLQAGLSITTVLNTMDTFEDLYSAAANSASTQDNYKTVVNLANSIVARYGYILEGLRATTANGTPMADLASITTEIQKRATNLVLQAETIVDKITTANTRTSYYSYLIGDSGGKSYIAINQIFDTGVQLLDLMNTETTANINKYRVVLAKHILAQDAFNGSAVATIDIDQDGYADFYEDGATQADINTSGILLDTDSDNDGIPDSMDSTPFYAQ